MQKLFISLSLLGISMLGYAQNSVDLANFYNKTWYEQPHQSDGVVYNFKSTAYTNVPGIDLLQFEEYFTCSFNDDGTFQYKEFDYCMDESEDGKPKPDGTSTQVMQAGKWKWIDKQNHILKLKFDGGCTWKVWIKNTDEANLQLQFKPISKSIQ